MACDDIEAALLVRGFQNLFKKQKSFELSIASVNENLFVSSC